MTDAQLLTAARQWVTECRNRAREMDERLTEMLQQSDEFLVARMDSLVQEYIEYAAVLPLNEAPPFSEWLKERKP